jgi:hypothetical protein
MRLAALYRRSADPIPGTEWLISIRIRILSYFLSRYADAPEIWRSMPTPAESLYAPRTFCIVRDPADHPVRSGERLRAILAEIHDLNLPTVPRWRAWLRRSTRGRAS